jgi:hypothetical protein
MARATAAFISSSEIPHLGISSKACWISGAIIGSSLSGRLTLGALDLGTGSPDARRASMLLIMPVRGVWTSPRPSRATWIARNPIKKKRSSFASGSDSGRGQKRR